MSPIPIIGHGLHVGWPFGAVRSGAGSRVTAASRQRHGCQDTAPRGIPGMGSRSPSPRRDVGDNGGAGVWRQRHVAAEGIVLLSQNGRTAGPASTLLL
jgi:hypothetical protein